MSFSPAISPGPNVIFVGNISQRVDEGHLHQFFQERFGPVEQVKIVIDSNTRMSKGYGFVRFVNVVDANKVKLQKTVEFDGRHMNCKELEPEGRRRTTGSGMPLATAALQPPVAAQDINGVSVNDANCILLTQTLLVQDFAQRMAMALANFCTARNCSMASAVAELLPVMSKACGIEAPPIPGLEVPAPAAESVVAPITPPPMKYSNGVLVGLSATATVVYDVASSNTEIFGVLEHPPASLTGSVSQLISGPCATTVAVVDADGVVSLSREDLAPPAGTKIVIGSVGANHAVFIDAESKFIAFGDNSAGQCTPPEQMTGEIYTVSCGEKHTLVVTENGVVAFGDNSSGQCDVPDVAVGAKGVSCVSAGASHSAAIISDVGLVCWGNPAAFEGISDEVKKNTTLVACGVAHTAVLYKVTDGPLEQMKIAIGGTPNEIPPMLQEANVFALWSGGAHFMAAVAPRPGGINSPSLVSFGTDTSGSVNDVPKTLFLPDCMLS